jgi:signal transduction histidine kinase
MRIYSSGMDWVRAAWRWWRRSPARDVVFAALMTAITVSGSYGEGHPHNPADKVQFHNVPIPQPSVAALLLVAVASLVLVWRNRWPYAVLAVSAGAVLGYTLLGYVNGAALVAPAAAAYALASNVSVRKALVASGVTLAALLVTTSASNPFGTATGGPVVVLPVLFAAACLGGIAVSNRRAFVASIQARAEDEARLRIDEERLRIARELHDVVAHTMSTINVQAAAAAWLLADRPAEAAEALAAIRTASKNGLRELRAILNVLRQADEADPTAPAPGLAQLDALIAGVSQAGLPTTLDVSGHHADLPPGADLAAYRIIQESLTNAIRHAGPATATVTLRYLDDVLMIDVTDTGRGVAEALAGSDGTGRRGNIGSAPWQYSGHGLAGMRERAAAAGGTLEAGPADGGGFQVTAALPLRRQDEPAPSDRQGQPVRRGEQGEPVGPAADRAGNETAAAEESRRP